MLLAAILAVCVVAGACASDDDDGDAATATTQAVTTATVEATDPPPATSEPATASTEAPPDTTPPTTDAPAEPVTVLLTNDDGIGAEGIDAVAVALGEIPGVEVVIVAPAENQSGSSDTTSPTLPTGAPATTASGLEGTAVAGTPADSVIFALDELGIEPDLAVSGANQGQNIGPFVPLSGTVGAARTAARRGIPAVAVSAGFAEQPDYATAADVVAAEVEALVADGLAGNPDQTVISLNTPTCPEGTSIRGVVDVPVATAFPDGVDGINLIFDCASTAEDPIDDVNALLIGYGSRAVISADL
jgi:5'-nucleotidase